MVKVSVIITTHNRKDLLKRALASVLNQTYHDLECIVVDDASDDGTSEMLKNMFGIVYIYIPKNEGHGANHARNVGVQRSKGEYVAFLDDDDYWLPMKIEKQVELMETGEYVLCSCGRYFEEVHADGSTKLQNDDFGLFFPENMQKQILYRFVFTTSLIMVRKSSLFSIGLFDKELCFWQEYEMAIRLAQIGKFAFVNDTLAVYRYNPFDKFRLSNNYNRWLNAVEYVYEKHIALYRQLSDSEFLMYFSHIWTDAMNRCRIEGYKKMEICYGGLSDEIKGIIDNNVNPRYVWKCFPVLLFLLPYVVCKKQIKSDVALIFIYKARKLYRQIRKYKTVLLG